MYTRISERYAPFILGLAGGGPGVVASPLFWGSAPVLGLCTLLQKATLAGQNYYFIYNIKALMYHTFLEVSCQGDLKKNILNFFGLNLGS